MTIVKCETCGKEFDKKENQIKHYKRHFCCRKCLKKTNKIEIKEDYAIIFLERPKYGEMQTLIDIEDVEKCKKYYWGVRKNKNDFYIESKPTPSTRIHLHRYLMKTPNDLVVDHINGNTLDNRKQNLRNVTQLENCLNKHTIMNSQLGITGIYKLKNRKNLYIAKFRNKYIGCFNSINKAIEARENEKISTIK